MTTDVSRDTCPLCAHPRPVPLTQIGHRQLARCAACGHRFVSLLSAAALTEEYAAAYYRDADDPRIAAWATTHEAVWDAIVQQLLTLQPNATSFLDIGSGSGGFLQRLRHRVPNARLAAVESSPPARAALAARMPDVAFVAESAERLEAVAARFDVVTLLQTLEHLADPLAALRGAWHCLLPGGLLFVTVPNRRSLAVLRRGRGADCYANGTHLQFFDARALCGLLRRAGFDVPQRLVHFGGGQHAPLLPRLLQYAVRRLGWSTEIRMVARRASATRPDAEATGSQR